ncbi:MAG TPA: zf-HC2 domain-containing protein [Bacteroidota bacterium]|nr:zf-HC2 domain-containing protein [Bacteroidota bacterium]
MRTKHPETLCCRDIAKHVCENLDENIDSPLCRKIKKHLQTCPECSEDLSVLKKTIELYREYPEPILPAVRKKNILTAIVHAPKNEQRKAIRHR